MTDCEMELIKGYYEGLIRNQRVMMGHDFECQWVTSSVASTMLSSWFDHHARHGTASWDVTIAKALSVYLQSSLDCHAVHITLARGYVEDCLR